MAKTEYARIVAGVCIDPNSFTPKEDGTGLNWNPHTLEHINDYNKFFNEKFLALLTELIGFDGWGIKFLQVEPLTPTFMVDIYVDDKSNFDKIANHIKENIGDIKINHYFPKGTVSDYIDKVED